VELVGLGLGLGLGLGHGEILRRRRRARLSWRLRWEWEDAVRLFHSSVSRRGWNGAKLTTEYVGYAMHSSRAGWWWMLRGSCWKCLGMEMAGTRSGLKGQGG